MRNNALDAAKLLACFFIIFVHVGRFPELVAPWGETLRVMARWAVPFFFLASGFTITRIDAESILRRVTKLIAVLFYGSIIYIPILYMQSRDSIMILIDKFISLNTLHNGAFGHLWFIGSLISGVILFWYARQNLSHKASLTISIAIVIMCWMGDVVKSLGYELWFFFTFRYLLGFALVYIGWCVGTGKLKFILAYKSAWLVFFLCIFLMGFEYYILLSKFGATHSERQFPLACIPAAFALICICKNSSMKSNLISEWGVNYSLGIYIIHLFSLYFISLFLDLYRLNKYSSLRLVATFTVSLIILMVMKKCTPHAYNKLNGILVK